MSTEPTPTFEESLRLLEQIVDTLERGSPGLTESLAKYEQGVRLLALCHGALDQAEQSVSLLTGVDAAGNPITAPLDESAVVETPAPAKPAPKPRKRAAPPASEDDGLIPF